MYIKLVCDYFEDCKIQGGNLPVDYNLLGSCPCVATKIKNLYKI
jgi:hypothetical protein